MIHRKYSKNTFLSSSLYPTGSKPFSALMGTTSGESLFYSYSRLSELQDELRVDYKLNFECVSKELYAILYALLR